MAWSKLLAREGVDITTISGIDEVFYRLLQDFSKSNLFFTYFYNRQFTHYIGVDSHKLGQLIYKEYFDTVEKIQTYYEDGNKLLFEIKDETERAQEKSLKDCFEVFLEQFRQINDIYSITSWIAIEAWQKDFEKHLNKLVRQRGVEERREEITNVIYTPWKTTGLIDLQDELTKGVDARNLVERYQFLRSWSVVWHQKIDTSWIKNIEIAEKTQTDTITHEEAVKLLNPDEKLKPFFELSPYVIFFKDWRDDVRRKHAYYWSFLFDRIADTYNVERDDIGYLTISEIEEMLSGDRFPQETINERKQKPKVLIQNNEGFIVVKSYDEKYRSIVDSSESKLAQKDLSGTTAQSGKVIGRVRIVRSYHDTKHVLDGDVLVANTTHPNYLPAMKRAVAFVTNEGGMISHAATVARELKTPCIVGTKVATEVLIDGDMVEVDATKGIVRKL